jgi:hypothetical protein
MHPIVRGRAIGYNLAMLALNENTTVRDLLTAYPQVAGVLLGHGMCEDCQADPPPVPLQQFARKHCGGDTMKLIAQLNAAIAQRTT